MKYRIRGSRRHDLFVIDYWSEPRGVWVYLHGGFTSKEKAEGWLTEKVKFDTQNESKYFSQGAGQ